jgi:putative restriction endonuclease
MRYWWVSQNQTYKYEVPGGFLWSPKTRADGGYNYFYATMAEVSAGDLVFSFCDTQIKAIGVVQAPAVTSPKPDFRKAGSNWSDVGWYVEVEFEELQDPIKPKDFMNQIIPHLPEKYSPLQQNGNGLQGIYLTEISSDFGNLLIDLSSANIISIKNDLSPLSAIESEFEINMEIMAKGIEGDLEKIQLVKARRGQGIFRANVRLVEKSCRVTGVSNKKHLRASHIKPWSKSDDKEKISGYSGLLLAPHVDHLFDQGFITFDPVGNLLVSSKLSKEVLPKWNISEELNVGIFLDQQVDFLDYHASTIFKK